MKRGGSLQALLGVLHHCCTPVCVKNALMFATGPSDMFQDSLCAMLFLPMLPRKLQQKKWGGVDPLAGRLRYIYIYIYIYVCVCACICLYVYTHAVFPKSVLETTWSCPLLHSMHFTLESKTVLMCYAALHGNLSPCFILHAFLHGTLCSPSTHSYMGI